MEKKVIGLLILTLSFCFQINTSGQEMKVDTVIHQGLWKVQTETSFSVLVSNDSLQIPWATIDKLEAAKSYFDGIFQTELDFTLIFVENKDWNKYAYFPPPGMPQAGNGNVILGLGRSVISLEVQSMIKKLPEKAWASLVPVYGKELNLDLFYRESLSIHELAHLYHFRGGTNPQRKWLQELFATMSMYSFVEKDSVNSFDIMNTYPEFILKAGDSMAQFKTLADFEEKYVKGMKPQNYEWYQIQFYRAARHIMEANSIEILEKMLNFLVNTDLSKEERLNNDQLLSRLEIEVGKDVADVMTNWKYQ